MTDPNPSERLAEIEAQKQSLTVKNAKGIAENILTNADNGIDFPRRLCTNGEAQRLARAYLDLFAAYEDR